MEGNVNIAAGFERRARTVSWLGVDYTILVGRDESGGRIGLFESTVPAGDGPPLHIHNNEDEIIHVLAGEYEFWLDGATRRMGPGEAIFLPRGIAHTFRVVSQTPGRNIAVLTPGGFEGFFGDASALDPARPADAHAMGWSFSVPRPGRREPSRPPA
jgi:quercetin dioxygenase-like cupin family protein